MNLPTRRHFLAALAAATAATGSRGQEADAFPPIRQITRGPGFHWFGYYDKLQFSPDNRFVLGNKVGFEHRSPTAEDEIEVGMVDLHEHDRWIPLGKTKAWCWQQGCMLQWIPGSESKVIWNDREQDRFVSHILDVNTGEKHTLPTAIYALSPNGREAVSCDFAHIEQGRRIDLGTFASPAEYTGEWRVDTHPRLSRDEHTVCIDSPHTGEGRQLFAIDIRGIA